MTGGVAASRRLSGRIAYIGADGEENGHEHFSLLSHAHGHILRAECLLDDVGVLRDVSLSLNSEWKPQDGFCRVMRHGKEEASLWFAAGDNHVRVEGRADGRSVVPGFLPTPGGLQYLGLHPLQGDALIAQVRGVTQPGKYLAISAVTNSISPNGDEAIGAAHVTIDVAYVGESRISVRAGKFAARHYRLRWRKDWAPADMWVRADGMFLLMRWPEVPTTYELTSFAEEVFA